MSNAKNGDNVKIHYTGTLEDGYVFDSSVDREPLEFTIGSGMVVPGFEKAVEGMGVGEKKKFTIPCAEAYGDYDEQLLWDVPRTQLPADSEPEPGMMLQAQTPEGEVLHLVVRKVEDENVTLDGNHPLAGKDLTFDVELVEVG